MQIAVQGDDDLTSCVVEPGNHGIGLAIVASELYSSELRSLFFQALDDFPGLVFRSVIHKDDFKGKIKADNCVGVASVRLDGAFTETAVAALGTNVKDICLNPVGNELSLYYCVYTIIDMGSGFSENTIGDFGKCANEKIDYFQRNSEPADTLKVYETLFVLERAL